MKYYKVLSTVLTAAVLLTGCAGSKTGTEGSAVSDSYAEEEVVSEESEADLEETEEKNTKEETAEEEIPEIVSEAYSFEPHVYSAKLSEVRDIKFWSSLYNLIDAVRSGEDTFKCADEDTYHLVLDQVTLNHLYPVACVFITEYTGDEGPAFENGIGRIEYAIGKDAFEEKRIKFEEDVEGILAQTVRSDYSDFEKCLALYEYMAYNFTYEYDENPVGDNEGSTYHTIKERTGICCELGSAYAYLLLQCGVDALEIQSNDDIYHAWTYVTIGENGYHCDPTWGLTEKDDQMRLWYFMETEEARTDDGFDMSTVYMPLFMDIDGYMPGYVEIPANDDTFSRVWTSTYVDVDREKNVLYCTDFFTYEDYEIAYDI